MAILDPTTDLVNETGVFIKLTVEGVDGWEYLLPAAAGLEAGEIGRVRQSSIMGKGKSRSCPNWRIRVVSTLTHHAMQLRPTHDVMKMIVLVFRLEPAAATSDGGSLQLVALGVREKFLDRIFPNRIKLMITTIDVVLFSLLRFFGGLICVCMGYIYLCRNWKKRPLEEIARVGTTDAVGYISNQTILITLLIHFI